MAAIAAISTPERSATTIAYPLAAATKVFGGTLAALDANARLVPASDTAGLRVIGRAEDTFDNLAGGAGAIAGTVKRSTFKFPNSATQPILATDVGKECFAEDDQTVAKTTTNKVKAGRVVGLDADGGVWVDTREAARIPSIFAPTSSQNATAAASDLATAQALANALKTNYNALQLDFTNLITALQAQGIIK